MLQTVRDRVRDPDFPSRSPLLESLPACILPALFLSVAARALALGVDFVALLVLLPTAFAPYLAVLLVVELLLAFFAVAPRLAAVRVLARATLVDDSLDTVRLTVAVRRLWRRLERYVLVAGVVVLVALLLFASAGLGVLAGIGLAFAIFALRGRLELAAGLLAGLLHPNAAIVVSALAPSAVVLVVLSVVFVVEPGASPAFVLGVHALGVGVGLVAARFLLAVHGPAAAVGADVASPPPVDFSALCAWTGAALLDRAVGVVPLLAVLVLAGSVDALAYAMAWRVSALLDAGLLVHAVVRPAVAAATATGSSSDLVPVSAALARCVVSTALWWTLMFALVVTGPLLALDAYAAVLIGIPVAPFGDLLRLFVLARLVVVALGPGAEVLEVSGHPCSAFRHRRARRAAGGACGRRSRGRRPALSGGLCGCRRVRRRGAASVVSCVPPRRSRLHRYAPAPRRLALPLTAWSRRRQIPSGHSARMCAISASRFVVACAVWIASCESDRIRSASPGSRSGPTGVRSRCGSAVIIPRESARW